MGPTSDDLRTIFHLLDEILALDPSQHDDWLAGLPAEHVRLRPTLAKMLAKRASAETADFLGRLPAFTRFEQDTSAQSGFQNGAVVGAYRLIKEIGQGGMGTVWLAERTDGLVKREVALKLPMIALHRSVAERFTRERDILATLVHPHIARLYDAGIAPTGQPWLAMEYVDGESIDAWCNRRRLPIRGRLELFLQVLGAVQYAHTNLVIHRDLKPSNILVTTDGQVRLLDFGIAKLMTDGEARETELTQMGGRALTPLYASPEQISGRPVSTASDVYSLGVILYELLCGQPPYKLTRDSRGALEEAILAADPVKPGQAAVTAEAALARSGSVKKIKQALGGDLDTIVLKTMKKNVADRYVTVDAVSQELRRYLEGAPVLARADSYAYRARKFVTRNRLPVAAASIAGLGLILGAAMTLWQAHMAREQAVVAQRESTKAKAVQEFLLDIFRANTDQQPDPVKARQTTARELLDAGAARVATSLKDAPEAKDEILDTLSDMYHQMGLAAEAGAMRRQRVDMLKEAFGPRDRRVADALLSYASDIANTEERGRVPAVLSEAKAVLDSTNDFSSETRGALLLESASFYRYVSIDKMRTYADEAVTFFRQRYPDTWNLTHALRLAALSRQMLGDYEAAESWHRETLAVIQKRSPGPSAWVIAPSVQLAQTEEALGNMANAEEYFRSALAASRQFKGPSHSETVQVEAKLGAFLQATGRRPEGWDLLDDALAKSKSDNPATSFAGVVVARYYAIALLAEGRFGEAEKYIAEDLTDARKNYPGSAALASALRMDSIAAVARGDYRQARDDLNEAMIVWRKVSANAALPSTNNPYLLELAHVQIANGEVEAARASLAKVVPAVKGKSTFFAPDDVNAKLVHAELFLRQRNYAEAAQFSGQALDDIRRFPDKRLFPALEATAFLRLGEAQQGANDPGAARANLERALQLRLTTEAPNSPALAEAQIALANCLLDLGERRLARRLIDEAKVIHAANKELGEHYRKPLRDSELRQKGLG